MMDRDEPLSFYWRTADSYFVESLGLLPKLTRNQEIVWCAVIIQAVLTAALKPEMWISYSRNHNWWARLRRYRGTQFTCETVKHAVDALEALR